MTFEQSERAIGMLTAGMSSRDVAWHFQHHKLTTSRILNRFQQTGNVADRPRSGRPRITTPWEDRFLTTSSRRNRFLSSRKLGLLLRNATGTRVCSQDSQELEALERLYRSTGLIFLQWQKKFLTIIIQSLHFSSLKKKGMEKTCEKRRKKW